VTKEETKRQDNEAEEETETKAEEEKLSTIKDERQSDRYR